MWRGSQGWFFPINGKRMAWHYKNIDCHYLPPSGYLSDTHISICLSSPLTLLPVVSPTIFVQSWSPFCFPLQQSLRPWSCSVTHATWIVPLLQLFRLPELRTYTNCCCCPYLQYYWRINLEFVIIKKNEFSRIRVSTGIFQLQFFVLMSACVLYCIGELYYD